MLRLELLELVQQPIELLVRDLRIVVDVVALFVMADGVAQLAERVRADVMSAIRRGGGHARPRRQRSREST